MVDLRCPECLTWMQGCFSKDDMKELDRLQTAGREEIQSAYEHPGRRGDGGADRLPPGRARRSTSSGPTTSRRRGGCPAPPERKDHPRGVSRAHPSGQEGGCDDGIRVRRHGAQGRHRIVPRDRRDGRGRRDAVRPGRARGVFVPVVVVELVLGVVIGPQVLDLAQVNDFTDFFADLGLGMLFFFAGYEIDLAPHPRGSRCGSALVGWALSLVHRLHARRHPRRGRRRRVAASTSGSALATTAIGTLIPVLSDTGELQTRLRHATCSPPARSGSSGRSCC